jgi:prepilin signal peptidase PulO-like enzyme (type II secretory pathway)
MDPILVFHSIALAIALFAAAIDARTGRIPNALTVPAALVGVLLHVPMGAAAIGGSVAGGVLAALLPWLMHRVTRGAAIGGGDVKLFAALGTLCGPVMGLEIEVSAFVTLAIFAVVRLAFVGRLFKMLANVLRLLVRPLLPARYRRPLDAEAFTAMRMGPAIFIAVASVVVRDRLLGWVPWLAG